MLLKELTGSQIFLNFKNLNNKFFIHLAPEQSHNQNRSRRKTENGKRKTAPSTSGGSETLTGLRRNLYDNKVSIEAVHDHRRPTSDRLKK